MSDNNPFENITGSQFAWVFLGIPAILGWFGFFAGWLLAPHLNVEVIPLVWAMYASLGWYSLIIIIGGGLLGVLAVGSMW